MMKKKSQLMQNVPMGLGNDLSPGGGEAKSLSEKIKLYACNNSGSLLFASRGDAGRSTCVLFHSVVESILIST